MAIVATKEVNKVKEVRDDAPRVRYLLGESNEQGNHERYFEPSKSLRSILDATDIAHLFHNPAMRVETTEGKSLKVLLTTPSGQVKFMGFISAGDFSLTLDEADIEPAIVAGRTNIRKDTSLEDLKSLCNAKSAGWQ